MNAFPSTADEFYALRDDRTNLCGVRTRDYQNVRCGVCISPQAASTAAGQTMLLAVTNLLSRWCRRVTIAVPSVDAHPFLGIGDLGGLVLAQMRDADPFGDFHITQNTEDVDPQLCIGSYSGFGGSTRSVCINASGWLASLGFGRSIELPETRDANRLGAIAAACLGVAQVFKMSIGMPPENLLREGVFDVCRLVWSEHADQMPWPDDLTTGKILMIGGGSVGSSAAYCARIAGLRAAAEIVDKDIVKIENFNRSPIFGRSAFGRTKADAVAAFLRGSTFVANPITMWWEEFVAHRGRLAFDFDVWLPLANEFGVRKAMQHSVPPLMVHASTSANWGVNHGRHIPGIDDCLADRFPMNVTTDDLNCATAQIEIAAAPVDAALPFASLFAGLLIVAELVRLQLPNYPHVPNFALFDWYGPLDVIQKWDRKSRVGCVCRDQGASFQQRFNPNAKYAGLSEFA